MSATLHEYVRMKHEYPVCDAKTYSYLMDHRIDISVIIPVYNAAPLLERCFNSVFGQHTQFHFEVVLVDDGSTDNSVEIIKKWQEREPERVVFYQQENSGPAIARNKGVELAHGEFCAYLDADDYWLDGYIEETVSFMKEHPECVAVTVAQIYMQDGVEKSKNPFFMIDNTVSIVKESFVIENFFDFWNQWRHICTGSTTMRHYYLTECGGQRHDLRICEDLEFWPYFASYGKWGFIPKFLFVSDGWPLVKLQGWQKYTIRFKTILS